MCSVYNCNELNKSKFSIPKNNEIKSLWEKSFKFKIKTNFENFRETL